MTKTSKKSVMYLRDLKKKTLRVHENKRAEIVIKTGEKAQWVLCLPVKS